MFFRVLSENMVSPSREGTSFVSRSLQEVVTQGPMEPKLGTFLLDKWRLDRVLGKGGMSTVYLATHRNGNPVAIKLLRPEFIGNTRAQERFLREGYIANRVDHPGAVRVLDDGVDQQRAFLVMELLRGLDVEALRQRRGGAFSPSEALWLVSRAVEIVEAAHAANIVHRDIKPQNLFLTTAGQVKLLDFGIASLRGVPGFTTLTDAAGHPGTPGFMAPEQVRGQPHAVGPRTDIWALGATLFRLLSARTVHVASTPGEMMVVTATQPPPSLATLLPDLSPALIDVVDRALSLDPEDRWATASELRLALERAVAGLPELDLQTLLAECEANDVTWDPNGVEDSQQRLRRDSAHSFFSAAEQSERPKLPERQQRRVSIRLVLLSTIGLTIAVLCYGYFAGRNNDENLGEEASAESREGATPLEPVSTGLPEQPNASPSTSFGLTVDGAPSKLGLSANTAEPPVVAPAHTAKASASAPEQAERPARSVAAPAGSKGTSSAAPSATERDLLKRRL
jgi:eukaryotic-like serine/threonine-protein kinase